MTNYNPPMAQTARRREQVDEIGGELRKRDLSDDLIDRDRVWEGKSAALRLLYATRRTAGRSAAYRAYLAREGRPLRLHATCRPSPRLPSRVLWLTQCLWRTDFLERYAQQRHPVWVVRDYAIDP